MGKNSLFRNRNYKKKTPAHRAEVFLSYIGFEPMTHALKGRCSTY